jgi:hypothetical protein
MPVFLRVGLVEAPLQKHEFESMWLRKLSTLPACRA